MAVNRSTDMNTTVSCDANIVKTMLKPLYTQTGYPPAPS